MTNVCRLCDSSPFDYDRGDTKSLNSEDSISIFKDLQGQHITLEDALESAGANDEFALESKKFVTKIKEDSEIAGFGLLDDEIAAIVCYTLEGENGMKPPYKIINESLAGTRDTEKLMKTRKLVYLLLSGLRKLPRFRPSKRQMFCRGIRKKVPKSQLEANGRQYYEKGNTVTWWGFTSTTTDVEVVNDFIKDTPESTLFNIVGENLWGYDIKAFSPYKKEEEILLEPEARVCVSGVVERGQFSTVNVTFQPFDHLVLEDIIPVNNAHEKRWECGWGECPDTVQDNMRYALDEKNPRVVTRIDDHGKNCWSFCTIIGDTPLPPNKLTSWDIKITKSRYNNGHNICVGVAPIDINRNDSENSKKCGWHFHCGASELFSGPPHNYRAKPLGPRKGDERYAKTGDTISVAVDTLNGDLTFAVNGVSCGIAYSGIPLDKPLVPCAILWYEGDSVELII